MLGVVVLIFALGATGATASPSAQKKAKVKLSVTSKGQSAILKKGIQVKAKAKGKVKTKVTATSTTFDDPGAAKLTKPAKLKLKPKKHKGKTVKKTVRLKLTPNGKAAIASCQARQITVKAGKSKVKFKLVRDTANCKPGTVDTSQADTCDFIGNQDQSMCMVPFPDDYYTKSDASSATGRLINFKTAGMPTNGANVHMDGVPYNLNDGFSPGQTIVVRIPGINTAADLAANDVPTLAQLGNYANPDSRIVVLDATTGERQPIWAEIDSNSTDPTRTAVLIHPSVNFAAKHRYIVAIRDLKDSGGNAIKAPEGFRYYRDDLPSKDAAINDQRDRFNGIFSTLRDAGIKRANLNLAWDFTVASDENIAGRVLHMRDDALAQLGDTSPGDNVVQGTAPLFSVTSVQNFTIGQDTRMARRVQGTFQVPCYMTDPDGGGPLGPCDPGSVMQMNAAGVPQQNGTYTANFNCMIPRSAIDGVPTPARPTVYGHGLLGSAGEATSTPQKTLGNNFNIMDCATDEIGLSSSDVSVAIGVLGELGKFPQAADRLQQGLLNEILLGRLLISPTGFVTDPAFHVDGVSTGSGPVMDISRLYYNGNSQGGIMGGAFMALSPDATRGSLGVPGMNYSVLLNRSVDFDQYADIALFPNYPDMLSRPLVLSMIQMLWDRGEANGYAHRMTDNPLPNTPSHEVLMNAAFGDHQVSNFTADTEARTIGASTHAPVVDDGRWPGVDQLWNIPRIGSYPFTDSALVYWDSGPTRAGPLGTDPPPLENVPNRSGADPHSLPRATLEEQTMVSTFLQPNLISHIDNTCVGTAGPACHDLTFGGNASP
jgi:hypothetical protein